MSQSRDPEDLLIVLNAIEGLKDLEKGELIVAEANGAMNTCQLVQVITDF